MTVGATADIQKDFWDQLCRISASSGSRLSCRAFDPNMAHKMNVSAGREFEVTLRFNVRRERVEADLTLKGARAKQNFAELEKRFRAQSEGALGKGAEWQPEVPNRPQTAKKRNPESHIRIKLDDVNPHDKVGWASAATWLIERAERLDKWREAAGIR